MRDEHRELPLRLRIAIAMAVVLGLVVSVDLRRDKRDANVIVDAIVDAILDESFREHAGREVWQQSCTTCHVDGHSPPKLPGALIPLWQLNAQATLRYIAESVVLPAKVVRREDSYTMLPVSISEQQMVDVCGYLWLQVAQAARKPGMQSHCIFVEVPSHSDLSDLYGVWLQDDEVRWTIGPERDGLVRIQSPISDEWRYVVEDVTHATSRVAFVVRAVPKERGFGGMVLRTTLEASGGTVIQKVRVGDSHTAVRSVLARRKP